MNQFPQYRRHSSSDRAFVQWNGKRIYLPGAYGSTESRSAYHRFLADNCGDATAVTNRPVSTQCQTVDALACLFMEANHGLGKSELAHYQRALTILVQKFGSVPVTDFGPLRLAALQSWLAETEHQRVFVSKSGKKSMRNYWMSRNYVRHLIAIVKRVFKWGVSQELIKPEQLMGLQTVRGLKRGQAVELPPKLPVAWEDVEACLPHLTNVVAAMVLVQWNTGCRPQDVCGLRPMDVDCSTSPWRWSPAKHKNAYRGQNLTIWLGPKAQAALEPWMDRPADEYCFCPQESVEEGRVKRAAERKTPLSCGNRRGTNRVARPTRAPGRRFATGSYGQSIVKACKKAGVRKWTPHQLRHARATLIREQYGLEAAQAVLGHASLGATQIYAKRLTGEARRVAMETG